MNIEYLHRDVQLEYLGIAFSFVFIFVLLRVTWIVTYRLWFHPLSKIPGPWLARVTDLYPAWYNVKGDLHLETERAHRLYGPIFRQGPNKLVTNSATALHDIYNSTNLQKSVGYTSMAPSPKAYNVFTAVDKNEHNFKRRVLNHGFSDQRLREFEPAILKHIGIFLDRLLSSPDPDNPGWSIPIDMTDHCRYLAYDIMGEFGFGQSFDLQTSSENRFLIQAVAATVQKAAVYVVYPELQRLHLHLLFYRKVLKMRAQYLALMSRLVKSRLSAGKNAHNDLFSFLVDAKDPETNIGFTEDELWAESRFLLIAGADTTSTAMTSVLFYLAAYPECYKRLAQEIRSTFHSLSEIRSGSALNSCKYLRACIDEAMRMSPPISATLWREVTADNVFIDGVKLPKGVDIGISPYAFHHNEDIFPDSFTFKPERWLDRSGNFKKGDEATRLAFSVFSVGSRACAGRNLAYIELSDILASVAWQLDMESTDIMGPAGGYSGVFYGRQREKEFQLKEHLTSSHVGPLVRFRARAQTL